MFISSSTTSTVINKRPREQENENSKKKPHISKERESLQQALGIIESQNTVPTCERTFLECPMHVEIEPDSFQLPTIKNRKVGPIVLPQSEEKKASAILNQAALTSNQFKPPSTPRKMGHPAPKKQVNRREQTSVYKTLSQQARGITTYDDKFTPIFIPGTIDIQNQPVTLSAFAQGSFMDVYLPEATHEIVKNVPNCELVIKLYNRQRVDLSATTLNQFLQCSIQNYKDACAKGVPVAPIYNIETALEDHFLIQKRMPNSINIHDPDHIKQIKQIFITSLAEKLILDLHPKNLLVLEDKVYLIDFVEDPSDGLEFYIRQALIELCIQCIRERNWDREQISQFLTDFTKDFPSYDQALNNQLILERVTQLTK